MTIDRSTLRKRVASLVLAAPLALSLWALILAGATLLQPGGRPVAVFAAGGPDAALAAVIAAGGSILEIRSTAVIAIAEDPAFVRRLYAEGSLIVVGARSAGCGLGAALRADPRTAV
jgi:hypothetical protein